MHNLLDQYFLFRLRSKQDPDAFTRLYDRYVEAIYRFAILKLPTEEDAQDVTSETFLKVWAHLQQGGEIIHVRAFFYQVARNLIADKYRQMKTHVSYGLVTNESQDPSTQVEPKEGDRGRAKRMLEARADFSLLLEQLDRLKPDYRDILTLRYIDGLPFGIIAQILNKTPGNVRLIFHRAVKTLKEIEKNSP
ncbi:sigma-70 family RNA polymerase sigma factor [Candidatus Uhrbacteria bacterium]|nr:sigma-70 family RNA polymerase sigma factor [Candidatus Uhrbacteria bacterium]